MIPNKIKIIFFFIILVIVSIFIFENYWHQPFLKVSAFINRNSGQKKVISLIVKAIAYLEVEKDLPITPPLLPKIQCTSGLCCDISLKIFKPSSYKCQEDNTTEYGCPWGNILGGYVGVRRQNSRYCSGISADCNGDLRWENWSRYHRCDINQVCNNGACTFPVCLDGTVYNNQCSLNKPKFCENGNLIDKCSQCGCLGIDRCQSNESCIPGDINELMSIGSNVFVMKSEDNFFAIPNEQITSQWVARKFYQFIDDTYDFLYIYSYCPSSHYYAFHLRVQNNIQGIGLSLFNNTQDYGSKGRLLGIATFGILSSTGELGDMGPAGKNEFRGGIHEVEHQWAAFVGEDLGLIEMRSPGHWYGFTNNYWDPIGGVQFIGPDKDGRYQIDTGPMDEDSNDQPKISPLTQYLMGLIPSEEVPPIEIFESIGYQSIGYQGTESFECFVLKDRIPIEKIIALEGERNPGVQNSKKHFQMAFILVMERGTNVPENVQNLIKTTSQGLPKAWYKFTEGKSTINNIRP